MSWEAGQEKPYLFMEGGTGDRRVFFELQQRHGPYAMALLFLWTMSGDAGRSFRAGLVSEGRE